MQASLSRGRHDDGLRLDWFILVATEGKGPRHRVMNDQVLAALLGVIQDGTSGSVFAYFGRLRINPSRHHLSSIVNRVSESGAWRVCTYG
jgi:hypothetical protein